MASCRPASEAGEVSRLSESETTPLLWPLFDDDAGETVPGEVVKAILDGGSPLRVWRKHRAFTLASLAGLVGVSKGYMSQIENGHKPGTLALFRRLAGVLDVSIDQLVDPSSRPGDGPWSTASPSEVQETR